MCLELSSNPSISRNNCFCWVVARTVSSREHAPFLVCELHIFKDQSDSLRQRDHVRVRVLDARKGILDDFRGAQSCLLKMTSGNQSVQESLSQGTELFLPYEQLEMRRRGK